MRSEIRIFTPRRAAGIVHIAVIAKTFSNFKVMPNLLYYSKEQKNPSGIVVSHKKIEDLLRSVEENDKKRIEDNVAAIYEEMNEAGMNPELVQMNMNYLLYRLVSLAMEQDDSVNQDEVLQYICENAFQVHMIRGSLSHFRRFVMEYADYLVQLRQNASRGVLLDVEGEIRKNYAENLTLKEIGKKYFVNRCSSFYDSMFALTGWKTVEINGIEFELNSILVEKWKGKPYLQLFYINKIFAFITI